MKPEAKVMLATNGLIWAAFALKAMTEGRMVALLFAGLAAATFASSELWSRK